MTMSAFSRKLRGLWLARECPFPMNCGDRIYTARLAESLAYTGVDLTMTGVQGAGTLPADWPVKFLNVAGQRKPAYRALLSTMPLVAAAHATPAYRQLLKRLANERWDFVVFDQYGMGWALEFFRAARAPLRQQQPSPLLIHIAHDHETSVARDLYAAPDIAFSRCIGLWQNYLKVLKFERKIVAKMDLLTAITEEDSCKFETGIARSDIVVCTPGYSGTTSSRAHIGADTPRHALMIGSFHWIAKQENLRRFVAAADAMFAANRITLDVVGAIPDALRAAIERTSASVRFHGFVEDVGPLFDNARIAVVPEMIGGGFKLKFLDYIFGRLPIATLGNAAIGLPEQLKAHMFCCGDMTALADSIVRNMDRLDILNSMQTRALAAARALFRWQDRGDALRQAIDARIAQRRSNGHFGEPNALSRAQRTSIAISPPMQLDAKEYGIGRQP